MITPIQDIEVMRAILIADPYLNKLGYNSENIYKYEQLEEEIGSDTKTISIYSMPSPITERTSNFITCIYGIKVVSTRTNITAVSEAVVQVKSLLMNQDIGRSHILDLYDPPMQISGPKGTVTYFVSFSVLASKYDPIKTV